MYCDDLCQRCKWIKKMGHLQVFNISDVNIWYVGPNISGPAPTLIEVPLQNNISDDCEDRGDNIENYTKSDDTEYGTKKCWQWKWRCNWWH